MKKIHYSWYIVFISGLLMFGISAQQMAGAVFVVQIANSLNLGMGPISMAFSTAIVVGFGMAPLTAMLYKKYSAKMLTCIAVLNQVACLLVLAAAKNPFMIVLSCVLESFSVISFLSILPAVLIQRWFKDRGQYAYSIILLFSMLGGVIFTPIASAIIEAADWRTAYRVLAAFVLLFEFPLIIIFFKEYPAQLGLKPYEDPNAEKRKSVHNRPEMNKDLTVKSAWRSRSFFMVCLYTIALTYTTVIQSHLVKHLVSAGFSNSFGASVITLGLVGGLLGRVILTYLSEKFGLKVTNTVYCGIGIVSLISLLFAKNSSASLVAVMGFLFGFAVRAANVQTTLVRYTVFGASTDFTKILANISIVTGIICMAASSIYGFMYDLTGNYTGGFLIAIVTCAIAIVAGIMLLPKVKTPEDSPILSDMIN